MLEINQTDESFSDFNGNAKYETFKEFNTVINDLFVEMI